MQHHHAVVAEQLRTLAEEGAVVIDADMLEHADRHDAVERSRHVAIVLQIETRARAQALFGRALIGDGVLFLRQRHAGHVGAGQFREIEPEPAPAAADVENAQVFAGQILASLPRSSKSLAARWRFFASWASSSDCPGFSK